MRSPQTGVVTKWRAGVIAAALCATVLAACMHSARTAAPGYVQVDVETSPASLDPRFATDAVSARISELLFDAMVKLDERGLFSGDIAESVARRSPTEVVFHLRRGIRFSDGRQLTARDVKYTYDSILDRRSLSPKRAALEPLKKIVAPDDFTIVMTTVKPYAPALELGMLGVVPQGWPARGLHGRAVPPGTGPFKLASLARDENVILERNPYRKASTLSPRGIFFKVVPDPTVRALDLAEGACDLAENNIQPDLLGYLRAVPQLAISESPGTTYQYLAFNFHDPRLRDPRVRRAIAYAIDRTAIVDLVLRGTARVASGMLSPENWAYQDQVMTYNYDPLRASALLEEAGYPVGRDGMRGLSLVYKTTPEGERLAELFQAMLHRVGIDLRVRSNEWGTFYADIQRGNFDLTSMQWVGISDPAHYYTIFHSKMTPPRGLNRGYYSNPEMDRLAEAGEAALEPSERRRIYGEVQRLAAIDLPYVSLWWRDSVAVMSRSLIGFKPYPNGSLLSLASLTFASPAALEQTR